MYGVIVWEAMCSIVIGGECANSSQNSGCESLPNGNCMNHYRG